MPQVGNGPERPGRRITYLCTIALILGVLWVLGLVRGYTAACFIHILLVIAVVMVLFNLIQGRKYR